MDKAWSIKSESGEEVADRISGLSPEKRALRASNVIPNLRISKSQPSLKADNRRKLK
jgi:hypothetical protein